MEFAITIEDKNFYVVVRSHEPTRHRPEYRSWTIWEGDHEPVPYRTPWEQGYPDDDTDTNDAALDAVQAILESVNP